MEYLFSYEVAKYTLIFTGYWILLTLEYLWIGYMFVSIIKWFIKNVKKLVSKRKVKTDTTKEADNK